VIAIIGVLVALLLPAVQAAREAARRSQCKNNLKQMALGSLNHYDIQKHFPTGGWGWFWVGDPDRGFGKDQPGGWIYNTLPFLEQQALHDMGKDGQPDVATQGQKLAARNLIASPLDITTCPSRRPGGRTFRYAETQAGMNNSLKPTVTGRSDYAANAGTVHVETEAFPANYAAAPGYRWFATVLEQSQPPMDPLVILNGISFQRSQVTLQQVTDGSSNTYMVGEKALTSTNYETGDDAGDNETWCTGFNNDNFRKTAKDAYGSLTALVPLLDAPEYPTSSIDAGGNQRGQEGFGSAHAGGVNMAYCDGSIHTVNYDIDWQIHRDLGDRADGNVTNSASP
jgi:prepilin-type processing-associated H-X9-DG protein